jgi:hypothetical protein
MAAPATTHVFRVLINRTLYRDIEILSRDTLADLARAIIEAYDFDMDHAYGFYSALKGNLARSPVKYELFVDMEDFGGESDAGSVERTRIADVFSQIGQKMTFLFDYGDEWRFTVTLKAQNPKGNGVKYPRVIKSAGEAPPQYPVVED